MNYPMTPARLCEENHAFRGTQAISTENRDRGFVPAFYDTDSGVVQRARFADGAPAPMHLLDGLPDTWVQERLPSGRVMAVKPSVVAGFLRQGRFYTREQAACALL